MATLKAISSDNLASNINICALLGIYWRDLFYFHCACSQYFCNKTQYFNFSSNSIWPPSRVIIIHNLPLKCVCRSVSMGLIFFIFTVQVISTKATQTNILVSSSNSRLLLSQAIIIDNLPLKCVRCNLLAGSLNSIWPPFLMGDNCW